MSKVSIIIPSYNHADFILETVQSCINQTYKGYIQIIIVDDYSTDNTLDVLSAYKNFSADKISIDIYKKEENKGLNDSINFALKKCEGEYVQLVGSDDILMPEKIEKNVVFLEKNDMDCVYSGTYILNENMVLQEVDYSKFVEFYNKGRAYEYICIQDTSSPLMQSALFKKDVLNSAVHIRNNYKSDDWAFLIFLFENSKVGFLNLPLIKYRQHEGNTYKKYLKTFPMRVDVISNLVPSCYQSKAYSNIFLSQGLYYSEDKKYTVANRFYMSSIIFRISLRSVFYLIKNNWLFFVSILKGIK